MASKQFAGYTYHAEQFGRSDDNEREILEPFNPVGDASRELPLDITGSALQFLVYLRLPLRMKPGHRDRMKPGFDRNRDQVFHHFWDPVPSRWRSLV